MAVPNLYEALSEDEWRTIRERGLQWQVNAQQKVVITDPTQPSKTGVGRTFKQAYAALNA